MESSSLEAVHWGERLNSRSVADLCIVTTKSVLNRVSWDDVWATVLLLPNISLETTLEVLMHIWMHCRNIVSGTEHKQRQAFAELYGLWGCVRQDHLWIKFPTVTFFPSLSPHWYILRVSGCCSEAVQSASQHAKCKQNWNLVNEYFIITEWYFPKVITYSMFILFSQWIFKVPLHSVNTATAHITTQVSNTSETLGNSKGDQSSPHTEDNYGSQLLITARQKNWKLWLVF